MDEVLSIEWGKQTTLVTSALWSNHLTILRGLVTSNSTLVVAFTEQEGGFQ